MMLSFTLSMPSVTSWNGKWSGEGTLYARVKNMGNASKTVARVEELLKGGGYFTYGFSDGWRAAVEVKIVDAAEGRRIKKCSKGFNGYDWMIDSILDKGSIEVPGR